MFLIVSEFILPSFLNLRGPGGGLRQNYLEIDFIVVSDRRE